MALGLLLGVLCIVAANAFAPRIRVAAPLVLVLVGVGVSVQPLVDVPAIVVEPHLILEGVLPLLLFAAAVSMPAVNFRRNFGAIAGLSVTLVVLTSLVLGLVFSMILPELGFAGGVALGAVLSPTDAVATSIVKRLGVAPRVVAVLDGEAMLNDASAIVVLRTAVGAIGAASASIGGAIGAFFVSILVATAIGGVVGFATLVIRKRIHEATVNTLLSFAVPLLAFQPAEHAGASGLVAVVAAGLVIGQGAPRFLAPAHRANERINWHTIEMLLEGGLFLVMGLQLVTLLNDARTDLVLAIGLSGLALAITLAIRALYVVPLLWGVKHQQERYAEASGKLAALGNLTPSEAAKAVLDPREKRTVARFQGRVQRVLADANYHSARPLGYRDAALLVWAGMRGAITLAAAQTLPEDFPYRSLLVLVAFLVAVSSLVIQGGSLGWVVRRLRFPPPDDMTGEQEALIDEIQQAGVAVLESSEAREAYGDEMIATMRERLTAWRDGRAFVKSGPVMDQVFDAQRAHVLRARREGNYSTETLETALRRIDAMQIGLGLTRRGGIDDEP